MKKYTLLLLCAALSSAHAQKTLSVTSPDGNLKMDVIVNKQISYNLIDNGDTIMKGCKIALDIKGENHQASLITSYRKKIKENVNTPLYKFRTISNEANSLTLKLRRNLNVEFRAYNEGVAYRFATRNTKGEYFIENETADFVFTGNHTAWLPYSTNEKNPKAMAFQATYTVAPLSDSKNIEAFLPATVDCGKAKVTILESDVEAYPGMFIKGSTNKLQSEFAQYPKTFDYYPWRMQKYVTSTEDYIAKCRGDRTFPWRILAVSHDDTEMPTNTLVYKLASPSRLNGDTSWLRPGKVAWDWWSEWGLSGVDFKSGINQQTYKYYIDFAAKNNIEYIILDEGWYNPKSGDMLTVIPELNLPELVEYGKKKNVGIILWTVFNVLDKQLTEACKTYSNMGIKGFKVDFLDRNDQEGVEMTYRIAEECAKYRL
ncbi:MAG: glycoside hydrolase family 97 N-terminal domain-containing protein, partial [Bacteroidaceae bacterium]|nr:glycoside hydrolase family 97 N-terminal domain-containing protein [Bacteroidaceae bacterium]